MAQHTSGQNTPSVSEAFETPLQEVISIGTDLYTQAQVFVESMFRTWNLYQILIALAVFATAHVLRAILGPRITGLDGVTRKLAKVAHANSGGCAPTPSRDFLCYADLGRRLCHARSNLAQSQLSSERGWDAGAGVAADRLCNTADQKPGYCVDLSAMARGHGRLCKSWGCWMWPNGFSTASVSASVKSTSRCSFLCKASSSSVA